MPRSRPGRLEQLLVAKSEAVQAFFRRRLRRGASMEAMDLAQEVYTRVLQASRQRTIQAPEAYLFTVARHLLEEHSVAERRSARRLDFSDPLIAAALILEPAFEREADRDGLTAVLRGALSELPPPCQAAVKLAYEDGLSYREIAEQLGVSKPMVQKYLARAITHCRQRVLKGRP